MTTTSSITSTIAHVGEVGIIFRFDILDSDDAALDLSTASVKKIYFRKPHGIKIERDAAFYTDGTDGIIQYISSDGDIDFAGLWKMQAYFEIDGNKFFTEKKEFWVSETLEP